MIISKSEARAICERVLRHVRGDDAEVRLEAEDYSHLRFAANSFTTSGRRQDLRISATVWVEGKKGSASTNESDERALQALARQAEGMARLSPVDQEYVPTLGPQRYRPTGGYVEATAKIHPASRAKAIRGVIGECEKAAVIGAGFHQARAEAEAGATKHGNLYYTRRTLASLSLTARTPDGGGSGYFLRNHFDSAKLDTARVAREAVQKALRSREPRTLDPGAYTVVLEPQAVADLLGFIFQYAFDARRADEGRSPFSAPGAKTRLGERVFDERIDLLSDPWHPDLPAAPFAQDGVPAERLFLVRQGVLANLIYTRFWARKKEKPPTPGPVNTVLESSAAPVSVEEMIKDTRRGLLVGRFWYIRMVNPRIYSLTGLTRDGVWYIENGQIRHPVRNFRFNQSILEMLAPGNVDVIGVPERVSSSESQGENSALLPPLKVKEFRFTSASEAV